MSFVKAVDLERVKAFDLESKRTGLPKVLLDQIREIREKMISISNQSFKLYNYSIYKFVPPVLRPFGLRFSNKMCVCWSSVGG